MKQNLFLILILFCVMSFAQTNSLTGTIFDSTDNLPLIGVNLVLSKDNMSTPIGTSTDLDGQFNLYNLES